MPPTVSIADPWGDAPLNSAPHDPGPPEEQNAFTSRPFGRLPSWLSTPTAHLLPLRLFIGAGWLRAWVEKAFDPAWYDGSAIREFLGAQLAAGAPVSDGFAWIMVNLLEPAAVVVGWFVILAQLFAGLAILSGVTFNLGLATGMALNASFMAAGAISPSAFYLVIQAALLGSGAGDVLSVAGPVRGRAGGRRDRAGAFFVMAWLWAVVAIWALLNAHEFGARAIEDPGTVLAFDAALTTAGALLVALRRSSD